MDDPLQKIRDLAASDVFRETFDKRGSACPSLRESLSRLAVRRKASLDQIYLVLRHGKETPAVEKQVDEWFKAVRLTGNRLISSLEEFLEAMRKAPPVTVTGGRKIHVLPDEPMWESCQR